VTAPIYLDYQASTPLDPAVGAAMRPYLDVWVGNPHSDHAFGWQAATVVEDARTAVADLIAADSGEIVITSGATEANNLAIQGLIHTAPRCRDHVVVTAIEHKCVLASALSLREHGFRVDIVPVGPDGIVDPGRIGELMSDNTALVSVMLANNEIGTLQPVAEVADLCRSRGIVVHTDAAQAVGKIPIDVVSLGVDLLSLSGHKMYGPQGIGALYISRDCPVALRPLLLGGAQQDGRRAGTVPVMLCAGLAASCKIAGERMTVDHAHALRLRNLFLDALQAAFPDLSVNGDLQRRLPGNLNIRLRRCDADSLLARLRRQLAASTGSACNSGLIEPSYVLLALGLTLEEVNSSIRFGFGRFTTVADVECAAAAVAKAAASSLRQAAE
jgi:cysteine desulfurase